MFSQKEEKTFDFQGEKSKNLESEEEFSASFMAQNLSPAGTMSTTGGNKDSAGMNQSNSSNQVSEFKAKL